jgi:hypothetical protein
MNFFLDQWMDDVEYGIGEGVRLYDIVLDLRDLADKNPAIGPRVRKMADMIDDAVAALVGAGEAFVDVRYAVEADDGDDDAPRSTTVEQPTA